MTNALRRGREEKTWIQRRRQPCGDGGRDQSDVAQAKEHLEPPGTVRGKRGFSPRIFSKHIPATTLIVDFWSLELGEINFCHFQLHVSCNLLWQPRKQIQQVILGEGMKKWTEKQGKRSRECKGVHFCPGGSSGRVKKGWKTWVSTCPLLTCWE